MKNQISTDSKQLVIELAKSLGVDFPKDKICKDCYHYSFGDDWDKTDNSHRCWCSHKVTIRPCDPDDMNHCDYTDPYIIKNLNEATECLYYKSGLEEYKKLYKEAKDELKELKDSISKLCNS